MYETALNSAVVSFFSRKTTVSQLGVFVLLIVGCCNSLIYTLYIFHSGCNNDLLIRWKSSAASFACELFMALKMLEFNLTLIAQIVERQQNTKSD